MTREQFEVLLDKAAIQLNEDVRASTKYHGPNEFQKRVFDVLTSIAQGEKIKVHPTFHPHAFPDIRADGFGVEAKSTNKDSWLSVGNSIFEGMRDPSVTDIYIMFGKMGGRPAVRWGRYEDRITHVRISHAPRFVIEMDEETGRSPLFEKMGVSYEEFCKQSPDGKMQHVRQYSRGRLKPGERLWWLEDENSQGTPLEVRLYMHLPMTEKLRLRAEGALLFPQICQGGRVRDKYNDVAFFFLKYHSVFCPQTRDLYSAGSVAGKARGGNYLLRALKNIEPYIRQAADELDIDLIEEYWGERVKPKDRIAEWLRRADAHATGWTPSKHLFRD
jgi:hypothetical protein